MRARTVVVIVALVAVVAVALWWGRVRARGSDRPVETARAAIDLAPGEAVAASGAPPASDAASIDLGPDASTAAPAGAVAPAPADQEPALTAKVSSFKSILKAQVLAIEPQMLECLERAAKAGQQPTGRASLTFIIAPAGDRIVVEATGVDHDETTLEDGPLLDCMREAARAMTFDSIPAGGDALSVYRGVVLDQGVLVEHRITEYSVLRDSDPPFP